MSPPKKKTHNVDFLNKKNKQAHLSGSVGGIDGRKFISLWTSRTSLGST